MEFLLYFAWFSSVVTGTHGLYCLTCNDIEEARNCDNIIKCATGQVCYSTQLVTSSGRIYRKMGCRNVMTCQNGVAVGKRQDDSLKSVLYNFFRRSTLTSKGLGHQRKRSIDSTICDECCNSDLCQTKLCLDKDAIQRGPVCFNCDMQLSTERCTKIDRCDSDETCGHHIPSGSNSTCWNCCDHDLCNESCSSQTVGTPISASAPHCFNGTPTSTCRLAASIVCQDKFHADNAGCSHYCGYC